MARRSGFGRFATSMARIAMQQAAAQAREAERLRRAAERQYERDLRAWQKQQVYNNVLMRAEEAAACNEDLAATVAGLESLLADAIVTPHRVDFAALKTVAEYPPFDSEGLERPRSAPALTDYLPPPLTGIRRLWPPAKQHYERDVAGAQADYNDDLAAHRAAERERMDQLAARQATYVETRRLIDERVATDNAAIDEMQRALSVGEPDAIVSYCALCLSLRPLPDGWPAAPGEDKIAYVPASRQLVIEYDLPPFDVVPSVASYKYVKSTDQITTTVRPLAQRKALYTSMVAQLTLRALHDLFTSDASPHIDTIVFNGYVDAIDEGTGQSIRPCLVTVRVTRDLWDQLNLTRVDPVACLKVLNASVSKSPSELAPVRPVMELSMVDSRFIAQEDVLSHLDQRPNLMALTPSEFEALIANLFGKMGLETRLTQASRDGGVDCVAYNMDPIVGGKVVIQAKRYKHTVGVSAVRDLYGTVQNEGASKGILVTTSGYGKAAYDFANNKPLTLLDGANLLSLLASYAGIEAKIEVPSDWKDPDLDAAAENG